MTPESPNFECGVPESREASGSHTHPEHRFTGVTLNTRNPEFRLIQGTLGYYGKPVVQETPGTGGKLWNPDFRLNPGTRDPGVFENPLFRVPCDAGNPEMRVTSGICCSEFRVSTGTWSSV